MGACRSGGCTRGSRGSTCPPASRVPRKPIHVQIVRNDDNRRNEKSQSFVRDGRNVVCARRLNPTPEQDLSMYRGGRTRGHRWLLVAHAKKASCACFWGKSTYALTAAKWRRGFVVLRRAEQELLGIVPNIPRAPTTRGPSAKGRASE